MKTRALSGIGIFLAVLLVIFIAGLILQGSDKASAKAHGPDLEYLKSVNTVAPPRNPELMFLLMTQFMNSNLSRLF